VVHRRTKTALIALAGIAAFTLAGISAASLDDAVNGSSIVIANNDTRPVR
jgi:hypothetical protein